MAYLFLSKMIRVLVFFFYTGQLRWLGSSSGGGGNSLLRRGKDRGFKRKEERQHRQGTEYRMGVRGK